MSLNRFAKKRDANEQEIVDMFEAMGCSVERLDTPMDLLVGDRGLNLIVEVKTKTGKLTDLQKKFIRSHKGQYAMVRSAEEARDLILNLRGESDVSKFIEQVN